jgi:RHS repeat-associated protein
MSAVTACKSVLPMVMINPDAQPTYYRYDARDLLQSLTDPWGYTTYYQRDAHGLEIAKLLPNGVTTYHNYDAAGQVTSILHVGPSGLLQSLYYTYDGDGRRTKIVREDGKAIYYAYDATSRLTGETWLTSGGTQLYAFAYQYDSAGNRKQKTFNSVTTTYSYNTLNQLTAETTAGATTYYTWAADGEMATKHDTTGWSYYTWDVDESLKRIQTPSDDLANLYNSRMQRTQRTEAGAVTYLLYDGQKLATEKDRTWTTQQGYVSESPSIYSPLVAQSGPECWFLFDALGTTLGLTSNAGILTDTFLYETFGTGLGRTGTTATPYQYVGVYGYYDEANVGLEHLWHRWYQPGDGRFLSRDALPARTSGPLYDYAGQLPTMVIDPTGLQRGHDQPGDDAWKCATDYMKCLNGVSHAAACIACAILGVGTGIIEWSLCEAALKAKNLPAIIGFCGVLPLGEILALIKCFNAATQRELTESESCDTAHTFCLARANRGRHYV